MLNISNNKTSDFIDADRYSTLRLFRDEAAQRRSRKWLLVITFSLFFGALFLPWTQNIQSKGYLTSLQPESRPQTLQSVISGQINRWYVKEGQFVAKGDTIMYLTEIKDEYFDPLLLQRTRTQIDAKGFSVDNYEQKARALETQVQALEQNRLLKLQQARNKIEMARLKVMADSVDLIAAQTDEKISLAQLKRMDTLFAEGLYSETQYEARKMKMQQTISKRIAQESKLLSSRNGLINAQVEINSIEAEYRDKISKAQSERFATLSMMYNAEAEVTKMENSYSNYEVRTSNYYLTAPQDGYITQAIKVGIGELIKEGEEVVTIMPSDYDLAIEMYVRPFNYPLMHVGEEVRIQFDGWPAIFFSGWPGLSVGTFGGRIVAIDNFTNQNGLYRILVSPDPEQEPWPKELRVGAGTRNFALLNDVPIWYELWRQINGFPPDFYTPENQGKKADKQKPVFGAKK